MDNITLTENIIAENQHYDVIVETIENKLSENIKKKLGSRAVRRRMLEQCGNKAFLMPDQLKFPIVNPDTCQIDCKLLHAAYVRARQWSGAKPGYREIANKAKFLLQENRCLNQVKVTLENIGEFNLDYFLDLFDCEGDKNVKD